MKFASGGDDGMMLAGHLERLGSLAFIVVVGRLPGQEWKLRGG